MLTSDTKRKIDSARDILVGKVPDPKAQVEQITNALIYKFMDDMDQESIELGGKPRYFTNGYEKYAWTKLMDPRLGGLERLSLYVEALTHLSQNPHLPQLFRDIFKDTFLPYRDPETLSLFLKQINEFTYHHSEELGNSFEYLLSVLGSQGDAGQFRTPRHIINFIISIINPSKTDRILDPACGTAGFLISAYKHILAQNKEAGLTPDERKRLVSNVVGYDISPDMVKLSRVNMYLHGFPEPHISEYDTLTSEDNWDNTFDVILANPPFMSPKGGIRPHKRFSIQANRAEVLFVDYIAEHLNSHGRAGIIVPEGVIFQSAASYRQLRKMLVDDNYLVGVISLPAGAFNPYSGVKTSILWLDKDLARQKTDIFFAEAVNDGYSLGAHRRQIDQDDLPQIAAALKLWAQGTAPSTPLVSLVAKNILSESGDYNLSASRYIKSLYGQSENWPMVKLEDVFTEIKNGKNVTQSDEPIGNKVSRIQTIAKGVVDLTAVKWSTDEVSDSDLLRNGDILFSHINSIDHLAKTAMLESDEKVIHGANLLRMRADNSRVLPKYALYILKSAQFVNDAKRFAQRAVNQASINTTAVKNLTIPLPPIKIQKDIVDELDRYKAVFDGARQVVENYRPVIKVNADWQSVLLGDICHIGGKITTDVDLSRTYIGADSIEQNTGRLLRTKTAQEQSVSGPVYKFSGNVLLYSKIRPYLNKLAYVDLDAYCSSDMYPLTVDESKVNPNYLTAFILSKSFNDQIKDYYVRASIPKINRNQLFSVLVPLPALSVQNELAEVLAEERSLIASNEQISQLYKEKIKSKIAEVWGE